MQYFKCIGVKINHINIVFFKVFNLSPPKVTKNEKKEKRNLKCGFSLTTKKVCSLSFNF